jgi:hypothetical protein
MHLKIGKLTKKKYKRKKIKLLGLIIERNVRKSMKKIEKLTRWVLLQSNCIKG